MLNNISNDLLNNKDFIKSILEKCPEIFEYIPEKFKNDKDFIFELLDNDHSIILDYISDDLKNDEDFIIKVIENYDENILYYTLTEIKNNFNVVKCSVKHYGTTLQFASDILKDNELIVLTAIEDDINALKFASDRLKKDKTFIIKCLKINKDIIHYINTYFESTKLYNMFYELEYMLRNQDNTIDKKQLLFFWNKIQYFKYLTNFDQYIINITKQYYDECFTNKNILLNMYNCEEVMIILNNNIIILALQDINLDKEYNLETLKQEYIGRYPNKKLIFI
jgi:hypothetical protein